MRSSPFAVRIQLTNIVDNSSCKPISLGKRYPLRYLVGDSGFSTNTDAGANSDGNLSATVRASVNSPATSPA